MALNWSVKMAEGKIGLAMSTKGCEIMITASSLLRFLQDMKCQEVHDMIKIAVRNYQNFLDGVGLDEGFEMIQ